MTTKSKRNPAYTAEDNRAICDAYVAMAVSQARGSKFVKAQVCRDLIEKLGRSRGSIEAKFMNCSAAAVERDLLPFLPEGFVKGYKPAPNRSKDLDLILCQAINQSYDACCLIHGDVLEG